MTSAAEIKANDVQKLRQMTGAGLMDCKKALTEVGGDMDKAIKLLRERGIAKSSKRADRMAGEGIIDVWISSNEQDGIIFELNCETDFVARNEEFISLSKKLLAQIKENTSWTSAQDVPQEAILEFAGKIGEKIEARRFARLSSKSGIVATYIHAGSKLGVLVQLDWNKSGSNAALKELAKEVAIQIAGANPLYVNRSEVPSQIVDQEKEIAKKLLEGQNKPAEILEKIALGKLEQFYAAQCLLDQPYVKDAAGKTKISEVIDQLAKKENAQISVVKFHRFKVGAE